MYFFVLLGLVVGFDKNVVVFDVWGFMGFGYVEMGIVMVVGQFGNL